MYPSFMEEDMVDAADTLDSSFFSKASAVPWGSDEDLCVGASPGSRSIRGHCAQCCRALIWVMLLGVTRSDAAMVDTSRTL